MEFTTENGEKLIGELVHLYPAFEGGMRYIFNSYGFYATNKFKIIREIPWREVINLL